MTCISVCRNKDGRLMMAGERKLTIGEELVQYMSKPKIMKRDGILIGAAGGGNLSSIFVEVMKIPKVIPDTTEYMYVTFYKAVYQELKAMNFVNTAGELNIPEPMECTVLVCVNNLLYRVNICGPDKKGNTGYIAVDEMETPFAIGSGAMVATTSLLKDIGGSSKLLTRKHLVSAIKLACQIDPFCGYNSQYPIDVLIED